MAPPQMKQPSYASVLRGGIASTTPPKQTVGPTPRSKTSPQTQKPQPPPVASAPPPGPKTAPGQPPLPPPPAPLPNPSQLPQTQPNNQPKSPIPWPPIPRPLFPPPGPGVRPVNQAAPPIWAAAQYQPPPRNPYAHFAPGFQQQQQALPIPNTQTNYAPPINFNVPGYTHYPMIPAPGPVLNYGQNFPMPQDFSGIPKPNPTAQIFQPVSRPFQPIPIVNPNQQITPPDSAHGTGPSVSPGYWKADVYAPTFVPQQYIEINNLPATTVRSVPPPAINYPNYIASFAGFSLLPPLPAYPALPEINFATSVTVPLTPDNYVNKSLGLLAHEFEAQRENNSRYDRYNVPLMVHEPQKSKYKLMVQGIREDCPLVSVGDMVHLRQLTTSGSKHNLPVGFTGCQYEAYIYGIDRQGGYIILRIDELQIQSGLFNVSFLVQDKALGLHARALNDCRTLLPLLPSGEPRESFLRHMLFPEEGDGVRQRVISTRVFSHKWLDNELNFEQQQAVNAIIEQNYGTVPYLISGPPGTGKTKTIVEAALQLVYAGSTHRQHIILCAPSNQAADTLAQRLSRHLSPKVLFRMQSPTRSFAEVPQNLMMYTFVNNDCFSLPEWHTLMRYKVIVTTCSDCSMLVEARCTNRDLLRWRRAVSLAVSGEELIGYSSGMDIGQWTPNDMNRPPTDIRLHWTALLIDEAAQGMESEALIPLSVVAPPEEYTTEMPIFAMAGDEKQLGPRPISRLPMLEASLIERLFTRPLYDNHPLSRKAFAKFGSASTPEEIAKASERFLPYIRPPFTNLVRNYRSHPSILAVPSNLFYHNTLIPEATGTDRLLSWPGWKGRKSPILFQCNNGPDELHEEGGASFYNLHEVQLAYNTARSLVSSGLIQPHELAIMSPFREQVRRLRNALRQDQVYRLRDVNVGPLEAYQGSEHTAVIVCTTRTRRRFLEDDRRRGLGVVFEGRRFCVAMTRAKCALVVIGNPWLLEKDPNWERYLRVCWAEGAVERDPEGGGREFVGDPFAEGPGEGGGGEGPVTPVFADESTAGGGGGGGKPSWQLPP